jgi:Spy/CpxP family protein refolding chaperone
MIAPCDPFTNLLGDTTMNSKMRRVLLAATAGALLTMAAGAFAQAPGGGPGAGPPRGGMGGFGPPTDRAGVLQRNGLDDPALKLTGEQKAAIDKAADAYLAEMQKVPAAAPGGPPSQEVMTARTAARDNLMAAVNKVLSAEQKKTLEAAQAARRGGMGGPGGPGGPGGARGPGPGGPPAGGPPGGA